MDTVDARKSTILFSSFPLSLSLSVHVFCSLSHSTLMDLGSWVWKSLSLLVEDIRKAERMTGRNLGDLSTMVHSSTPRKTHIHMCTQHQKAREFKRTSFIFTRKQVICSSLHTLCISVFLYLRLCICISASVSLYLHACCEGL
jgi:hypothetical protein